MSPLVSIMTPCCNGEKFAGRYLDSVLAQTYDNIEVVIVDDGSTDKTAEIIKSYIPKFDAKGYKLVYVYQENGGAASALNQAIPILSGDFISWFDSDDILLPQSTEKRVNFLQQNPQYDFCICQMLEVNEDDLSKVTNIWRRTPPPRLTVTNYSSTFYWNKTLFFPTFIWCVVKLFLKRIRQKNCFLRVKDKIGSCFYRWLIVASTATLMSRFVFMLSEKTATSIRFAIFPKKFNETWTL